MTYLIHTTIHIKSQLKRCLLVDIDSGKENIGKNTKFKVTDHVGITKYRNIFAKRLHSTLV